MAKAHYIGNPREEATEERIDPGIHQRALRRTVGRKGEERAEEKVHPGIERQVKRTQRRERKRPRGTSRSDGRR